MDQYNYIREALLQDFFPKGTTVSFQSSPFPLIPAVEIDVFKDLSLAEEENEALTNRYHGTYNH